jgi:hypothetical protein
MRTMITFFLFLHPSFGSKFLPCWNRSQNYLFPDRKRKIFNKLARKNIALMTSLDPFLSRTRPDWTGPTVFEQLVREAPFTLDILDPHTIHFG